MDLFNLFYFILVLSISSVITVNFDIKKKCVDPDCKSPISDAVTKLAYNAPEKELLSFPRNAKVKVYGKVLENRSDLWEVEYEGKRGYVPFMLLEEKKILGNASVIVEKTIPKDPRELPLDDENGEEIKVDRVQKESEVVEGTTIYPSIDENLGPTLIQHTGESMATTPVPFTEPNFEKPAEDMGNLTLQTSESYLEPKEVNNDITSETEKLDVLTSTMEVVTKVNQSEDAKKIENFETVSEKNSEIEENNSASVPDVPIVEESVIESNEIETSSMSSDEAKINLQDIVLNSNVEEHDVISEKSFENVTNLSSAEEKDTQSVQVNSSHTTSEEVIDKVISVPTNQEVNDTSEDSTQKISDTNAQVSLDISAEAVNSTDMETTSSIDAVTNPIGDSKPDLVNINNLPLGDIESNKEHSEKSDVNNFENFEVNDNTTTLINDKSNINTEESNIVAEEVPYSTLDVLEKHKIELSEVPEDPKIDPKNHIVENKVEIEEIVPYSQQNVEVLDVPEISKGPSPDETRLYSNHFDQVLQQETDIVNPIEANQESETEQDNEIRLEHNSAEKSSNSDQTIDNKDENIATESLTSNLYDSVLSIFYSYFESAEKSVDQRILDPAINQVNAGDETVETFSITRESSEGLEAFLNYIPTSISTFFLVLFTSAIAVVIFLLGYVFLDKSNREGPLIAKINKLERDLLVQVRENEMLRENAQDDCDSAISNQEITQLKSEVARLTEAKESLEEQVQSLEKELESSTEVGLELNRLLSEAFNSQDGSEVLMTDVEQLRRQLVEQEGIVTSAKESLNLKDSENLLLQTELNTATGRIAELQTEMNKLLENILRIEDEKNQQQTLLQAEINEYESKCDTMKRKLNNLEDEHKTNVNNLQIEIEELKRNLAIKTREFDNFKNSLKEKKENLKKLLDFSALQAEVEQLRKDRESYNKKSKIEETCRSELECRLKQIQEDSNALRDKYEQADKMKVEVETKLEVLSNYFKEKEASLQKELSKYETMWATRQDENSSTTERIKYMQSELQNYKAQNESLKQEIVAQEVELKSQISMLEKKVHENWVTARQAERRLEDLRQESTQLRNRLTLRERNLQEDKSHLRIQSPLEQQNGGEHIESTTSPLIFGPRELMTKSPPISGLPFLPPPPGAPFMPPPMPFLPPPHPHSSMFPGDHRPPPLGRMSSPPLNSRFSPLRAFSPPYQERNRSPSPSNDDESEYRRSPPPPHRGYAPYRNEYKKMPPPPPQLAGRTNGRKPKGGPGRSSGSEQSTESAEKHNNSLSNV